jgi:hypothetical protein
VVRVARDGDAYLAAGANDGELAPCLELQSCQRCGDEPALAKVVANAKQKPYRSNTENNHAYRGDNLNRAIPALGRNMGVGSAITRYGAGAGR